MPSVVLAKARAARVTGRGTYGDGTYGSSNYGEGASAGTLDAPERTLLLLAAERPLVIVALPGATVRPLTVTAPARSLILVAEASA